MSRKRIFWIAIAALVIGLGILPLLAERYIISLVFLIFLFATYAESWNILSGYTGYINFGFAWFIGLGAYTSALLIADYGVFWLSTWMIAALFVTILSAGVGYILLRIKGIYFAISMLALTEGTRVLFGTKYLGAITHGGGGVPFLVADLKTLYYAMGLVMLACIVTTYKIATSPFGLKLLAIREDEGAAEVLGVNTTQVKVTAFMISAFFAGLAASIHAAFLHFIDPLTVFDINLTLKSIIMALFGSMGTVFGPLVGATLFTLIQEIFWSQLLELHMVALGVVLVLLTLFLRQGVLEWLKEKDILPRLRKI